jgi:hypothetical protein
LPKKITLVNKLASRNASGSMSVTPQVIVTLVNDVAPLNAWTLM